MAHIELRAAGRMYSLACRDGEEDHLVRLAALVDRKCSEATRALGVMSEPRLLFTAALLLADELVEIRKNEPDDNHGADDMEAQIAIMADRVENLCAALERRGALS